MRRLREDFGLEPVEYPTTRRLGATGGGPGRRPDGRVRRPVDPRGAGHHRRRRPDHACCRTSTRRRSRADPKPFFGYCDNTNLLNWLWTHGVAGYHGGSTMVHLGRGGGPAAGLGRFAAGRPVHRRRPGDPPGRASSATRSSTGRDPASLTQSAPAVPEPGLDLAPSRTRGDRADLGRQPGDPALEPGREPVDPADRGLRRLRAAAGDLRGDAAGRGGLPDAAQRGGARAARAVPGRPGRPPRRPPAWRDRRPPEERRAVPGRPAGGGAARARATTTRRRWWSSASTSDTPIRSGCCRTADASPSTARPAGSPPTTERGDYFDEFGVCGFLPSCCQFVSVISIL